MATIIRMKRRAVTDILELALKLYNSDGLSEADLVTREIYRDPQTTLMTPSTRSVLLCYEKFFFRTNAQAALTIMISQEDNEQKVLIVAFGAGQGILGLAKGADDKFAGSAVKELEKMGFHQYQDPGTYY